MPYLMSLPRKVYPAFAQIALNERVMLAQGSRAALYSLPSGKHDSYNVRRSLGTIVSHGLMKKTIDGDFAFTSVGYALAVSIRAADVGNVFDLFLFLNGLDDDMIAALLSTPSQRSPWWGAIMTDLKIAAIRQRTGQFDLALDVDVVLEFLRESPRVPHPPHLQEPPAKRSPDMARFNMIREACALVWGEQTAANHEFGDQARPRFILDTSNDPTPHPVPEPDFGFDDIGTPVYTDADWDIL